jgi:hypothetical protein
MRGSWLHIFACYIVSNVTLLMCSYCLATKNALVFDTSAGVMNDLCEAFKFMTDTHDSSRNRTL